MEPKVTEIEQLKAEIDYYKKVIKWYRETYETRSTIGVIKEKLKRKIKNEMQVKKISVTANSKRIKIWKRQNQQIKPSSQVKSIDKASFYSVHQTDEKLYKIGIFIHLFYQDLWPEINSYLENIGLNFDLFISINEEDKECANTIQKIKKDYPKAIVLKVPNKGLDIGPFFELINYAISKNLNFDYILKLHTKKSIGVNAEVGEWWRKKSYESLMGSSSVVSHILRLFRYNPSFGMIGPYETRTSITMNDLNHGGNINAANLKHLAKKLEIKDTALDFFGGTMFWAKWSIFKDKFKKTTLHANDFEHGYQKDGLLSHAMERLFASIVRDAGYELYEMSKINDYLYYKNRRKKICWIHPGYGIGGGNRIIFDICQHQLKHYDVYSISYVGQPFNNWMNVKHNVLSFYTPEEAEDFINICGIDYVFATGWQTVDFVKRLTKVEKKFYFIQDYEPWFADADIHKAMATYSNTFDANIVYADWVKQKLKDDHDLDSVFVKCGVSNYNNKCNLSKVAKPYKILLYYKLKNHQGRGADLIESLLKKLTPHKHLELNVIGHENPGIEGINFLGELHKNELLELYSKSDLFVDLSRHRGVATIALEVAQYGVVSLLSKKEFGLLEYGFEGNTNCLFVDGVEDAYKKVLALSNDVEQYKKLKKGVFELSSTFRYEYTVNDFNQVVDVIS